MGTQLLKWDWSAWTAWTWAGMLAWALAGGFVGYVLPLWVSGRRWGSRVVAYRLRLPGSLTTDDVARWAGSVGAATERSRWMLAPLSPIGVEVVATPTGIAHYLLIDPGQEEAHLSGLRAAMPGVRIDPAPEYRPARPTVAREWTINTRRRPAAIDRTESVTGALLSSMLPLWSGEMLRMQVLFTSAGTPNVIGSNSTIPGWLREQAPADADETQALRVKHRDPLLNVCIRMGVTSPARGRAQWVLSRTWGTLHGLNVPGVKLVRRRFPSVFVVDQMAGRALPAWKLYPLILNAREMVGVLGFPLRGMSLPGLMVTRARQLAPSPAIPDRGMVVATSNYPGLVRPLAVRTEDRLRHTYILGPTGTGKSTLIANMVLQDIHAGHGVVVVDPKSDLIGEILSRVPAHRADDVILMDPSATDTPVGFNLLAGANSEAGRELVTDHVVHIMSGLWASSWGPRTSDILRNCLLTLTHTRAADGSGFTLVEIPELLTNASFRRFVTSQPTAPAAVRQFWRTYEQMSEGERIAVIGPAMNKLRALTTRTPLRLMLGQPAGLDLAGVFRHGRILLVPLSKGIVGADTAQLLGALLIASAWQATTARSGIPENKRRPVFVYADEFQDILRLPLDIADMLAQARGLGVGLPLAHQVLGQLPDNVRSAVLGTARTQVVFGLDFEDARIMARRFAPLTEQDLMGLAAHEVAARLCVAGQTLTPVTGSTAALGPPGVNPGALARYALARYGTARRHVENDLRARLVSHPGGRLDTYGRLNPNQPTESTTSATSATDDDGAAPGGPADTREGERP